MLLISKQITPKKIKQIQYELKDIGNIKLVSEKLSIPIECIKKLIKTKIV